MSDITVNTAELGLEGEERDEIVERALDLHETEAALAAATAAVEGRLNADAALLEMIQQRDELVDELEQQKKALRARILQLTPDGGVAIEIGTRRIGVDTVSTTVEYDVAVLSDDDLEKLAEVDVDGRAVLRRQWYIDGRYFEEACRRGLIDHDDFVEKGAVKYKRRTPAIRIGDLKKTKKKRKG